MKKVALFFLAVVVLAALGAFCTVRWSERHAVATSEIAAHKWLHQELQLTEAQHQALEPIEARFAEKQRQLSERLNAANRKLAQVMAEEKGFTPRVAAEVEAVHHCMGDLQKASIEHVYEMRSILTPEQGDKLMRLAQRALENSP